MSEYQDDENRLINEIAAEQTTLNSQYISLTINYIEYAIPIKRLREIIILPKPTPTPEAPEHIRGVIQYRGDVITIIDSRKRLGFRRYDEEDKELIAMMATYKKAHLDWLAELTACVDEDREFKLTTDPHACAFGKWYDNFRTDNVPFMGYLKLFDAPHKKIHAIAKTAIDARKEFGLEAAQEIIRKERDSDLKEIVSLFEDIENILKTSHRELAMIIEDEDRLVGLTADSINNILNINPNELRVQSGSVKSKFVKGVHTEGEGVVLVLDLEKIID